MRITSLVENTVSDERLGAEHGLSLYIETEKHRILFDMGQTDLFAKNAEKLGIDLQKVDLAVLSHGHYDHGGGLRTFLQINNTAPVYVSPYAFEPHYHGPHRSIGLDVTLLEDPAARRRIRFTEDRTVIGEGLMLYSCRENERKYDLGYSGLDMVQDGRIVPDDFRHEQYLLIEGQESRKMTEQENAGRVLISGCSHKGILDIAGWFRPDVLVGGFHFSKFPLDEKLASYARYLDIFPTDYYTCHCTGREQYTFMKAHMKRLFYLSTGQTIIV